LKQRGGDRLECVGVMAMRIMRKIGLRRRQSVKLATDICLNRPGQRHLVKIIDRDELRADNLTIIELPRRRLAN
jgi:hypothetical protein